jgi:hypothetical protein
MGPRVLVESAIRDAYERLGKQTKSQQAADLAYSDDLSDAAYVLAEAVVELDDIIEMLTSRLDALEQALREAGLPVPDLPAPD